MAVWRLEGRKAAGPGRLKAEYLKFAGKSANIWLTNIMNGIVELEGILRGDPSSTLQEKWKRPT